MFPTLRVSFNGLEAESRYYVLLDVVGVDQKRYRYAYHRSSWLVAGKADPPLAARLHQHHDSPLTGEQLARQTVSFEKLKLTNNLLDKSGHVIYVYIYISQTNKTVTYILLCYYFFYNTFMNLYTRGHTQYEAACINIHESIII